MLRFRTIVLGLWFVTMLGCATTDDPRQGGLFSYNPAAYERRLENQQRRLGHVQQQGQTLQDHTKKLQDDAQAEQQKLDEQRAALALLDKELTDLDTQLLRMRQSLVNYQAQTHAKQQEKQRVMAKVTALKERVRMLRQEAQSNAQVEAEKRAYKTKIEHDITTLFETITILTSSSR